VNGALTSTARLAWAACAPAALLCACSIDPRVLRASTDAGGGGQSAPAAPLDDAGTLAPRAGSSGPSPGAGPAGTPSSDPDAATAPSSGGASGASPSAVPDGDAGSVPAAGSGADGGGGSTSDCHQLVVNEGWVDDSSNCLEIQGEVWHTPDDDETFYYFYDQSSPVCMASFAGYEATFGFNLSQDPLRMPPRDYDATAHSVRGFRFDVGMHPLDPVVPPPPFMGVLSAGSVYCIPLPRYGSYEVELADLHLRCWESDTGPTPDLEHVTAIVFYAPPQWATPSAMCLEEITVLVDE
jgi:hypothetical protein